jgi:hypothetical protein
MKLLIFFILSISLLSFISAHGFDIQRQQIIGNHTIEFGRTIEHPVAGERIGLSVSIDEAGVPINSSATVRISKGNDIFFISDGLQLSDEKVLTMSFIFPEPGTYDVDISAGNDRANFKVEVTGTSIPSYLWILLALTVGLIIGFLIRKSTSSR